MTPAQARLKRAVRTAVEQCGGVDGAAATANRRRSIAGDWGNLQHTAFPTAECALAMDEAIVAQGRRPPIASALARELGGVFTFLPDGHADVATMHGMLASHARTSGELQAQMAEMLADGATKPAEARAALVPAEQLLSVLVGMIDELREIAG